LLSNIQQHHKASTTTRAATQQQKKHSSDFEGKKRRNSFSVSVCLSRSLARCNDDNCNDGLPGRILSLLRSTVCTYHVLFPTYFPKPISYLRLPMPLPILHTFATYQPYLA
jgi:hypothetical protein